MSEKHPVYKHKTANGRRWMHHKFAISYLSQHISCAYANKMGSIYWYHVFIWKTKADLKKLSSRLKIQKAYSS